MNNNKYNVSKNVGSFLFFFSLSLFYNQFAPTTLVIVVRFSKDTIVLPILRSSNIHEKEKTLAPRKLHFSRKKRDFPFRREKEKKNRENFLVAHDSSAKYASIFFSLFLLSLVESPPLESHDQAVPYFFYTRLPSSPPPLFSVFNVCFLPFSLSLTLSLTLFLQKGVTQGK